MLKGFCAYAREDAALCRRLLGTYLKGLNRRGLVEMWYDGEIAPGRAWDADIRAAIEAADVVLLLVSQDFMASDYIADVEVPRVMQRHHEGFCLVLPIHLSPADIRDAPFRALQALPSGARPVSEWGDGEKAENRALLDVAAGVEAAIFAALGLTQYRDDVRRALYAKYFELNAVERGLLGRPVTPDPLAGKELTSKRGSAGYVWPFTSGASLCRTADSGVHPVWGSIGYRHRRLGGVEGVLGFPLTDEVDVPAEQARGRCQRFEGTGDWSTVDGVRFGASVYWQRGAVADRAFATWGGIGTVFESLGGANGVLGFPTSFEEDRKSPQGTEGVRQNFEHGAIYYRGDGQAAVAVTEPIMGVYRAQGGASGRFGFPKGQVSIEEPNTHVQEFEGGLICVRHVT